MPEKTKCPHRFRALFAAFSVCGMIAACSGEPTQPGAPATPSQPQPSTPSVPLPPIANSSATVPFIWTREAGMRRISLPNGATAGVATAINNHGQVTGWYVIAPYARRAFVWSAETGAIDINPAEEKISAGAAINDLGEVVINCEDSFRGKVYLWSEKNGSIRIADSPLEDLAGYGINDAGQVVGYRVLWDDLITSFDAFTWSAQKGLQSLSSAYQSPRSIAYDVNNSGQIAGFDGLRDAGSVARATPRLWLSPDWLAQDLAGPNRDALCHGGYDPVYHESATCGTSARAINDIGVVAGSLGHQAFRWQSGTTTLFQGFAGEASFATGINNRGDVAGHTATAAGKTAFIWYASGPAEKIVPATGLTWTVATGINDRGEIVGFAQ